MLVLDIHEQASGGYWATMVDEAGNLIPGSTLTTLTLTLYTLSGTGAITIINGRDHQNVLNLNDVQVFNTLQTRSDGKTYNLLWQIRPEDTTLVNPLLAFERHIAVFEWTWPNNHAGSHEIALAVKNLLEVP